MDHDGMIGLEDISKFMLSYSDDAGDAMSAGLDKIMQEIITNYREKQP